MVFFSPEVEFQQITKAEEAQGKLAMQHADEKLMRSVLQNDKEAVEEGKLIEESINRGLHAFIPSLMFENLVKNFSIAKQLYGERLLRLLTGYSASYLERNLRIPEFRKELKKILEQKIDKLEQAKLVDDRGEVTEKGIELASIVLYMEELDRLVGKGLLGEKLAKTPSHYGEKTLARTYKKGDRYKNIAVRQSVHLAIKRGHKQLGFDDLRTFERQTKGQLALIYGLDASASMKGEKLETAKKAGVALAYKAIGQHDKVGLVVFGSDVKDFTPPSDDFGYLLQKITRISASQQTDFVALIQKATELFPPDIQTKHLIIITDALPTTGEKPEETTLQAVSSARAGGITISLIGIQLDAKGKALAEQIVRLAEGRLYVVKNLGEVDAIMLAEYGAVAA